MYCFVCNITTRVSGLLVRLLVWGCEELGSNLIACKKPKMNKFLLILQTETELEPNRNLAQPKNPAQSIFIRLWFTIWANRFYSVQLRFGLKTDPARLCPPLQGRGGAGMAGKEVMVE